MSCLPNIGIDESDNENYEQFLTLAPMFAIGAMPSTSNIAFSFTLIRYDCVK